MTRLIIETEWSRDEAPIQKGVVSGETELLDAPYELHDLCTEGYDNPGLYDEVIKEILAELETFKIEHYRGLMKINALFNVGIVGYWKLA